MGVRPDGKVDGCDVTHQVSVHARIASMHAYQHECVTHIADMAPRGRP